MERSKARPGDRSGLLAKSPDMFEHSGQFFGYYDWESRDPIIKTNYVLRITLPLHHVPRSIALNRTMASLNCPAPGRTDGFAGIYLERLVAYEKIDETKHYEQYARVELGDIFAVNHMETVGSSLLYMSGPRRPRHLCIPIMSCS